MCHVTHTHTHLKPVKMAEEQISRLKDFLLTYVMPEKCYEHFFIRMNLRHGPCVKIIFSKLVSVWLLGELIAPLFQIWKVLKVGSVEGLSSVSAVLDLLAVTAHIVYCIQHNFPIGAFGESVFVFLQLLLLYTLIHYYRGKFITGCALLGLYSGFLYLLSSVLTANVVVAMWQWRVLIIITSRLIQAGCNLKSGSTGQLSALSVLLAFLASLSRTYGSIQDSPESLGSQACVLSSCCSLLLLLQIWIYRKQKAELREKQKDE